jgi:hypothetical protein
MKVVWRNPAPPGGPLLLWVLGSLVLPMLLLVGFGAGVDWTVRHDPPARVAVVIDANRIEMPPAAAVGNVTFVVTNHDSVAHRLMVQAVGAEQPLGGVAPVRPGETATAQFTLGFGSYEVYCPARRRQGLTHLLSVLPNSSPAVAMR